MLRRYGHHYFGSRIRFNWGYHDGAADAGAGMDRRTIPAGQLFCLPADDESYVAGYAVGQQDFRDGTYAGDSSAAWARRKV